MMAGATGARVHVDGLLSWWALAGVEGAVAEEGVNWLRPVAVRPVQPAAAAGTGFPAELAAFEAFLAASPDLPERRWPGKPVLPTGPAHARLMVILPAPETGDTLLDEAGRKLVTRMLAAIGLAAEQVYFASLSLVAPPGGRVDADLVDPLAERMRHHVGLVGPAAVLMFGDQTKRALTSAGGAEDTANLLFVNQSGGMVKATAVHHPRLLMQQPSAKADAWRTLQRLAKVWAQ